jgi:hypothetical protein
VFLRWTSHGHAWDPQESSFDRRPQRSSWHEKNRRKLSPAPERQRRRKRHIMRLGCCGCQRRLYAHRAVQRRKVSDSALNPMRALFPAIGSLGIVIGAGLPILTALLKHN